MGREVLLDLSELEPPAPLQQAIIALDSLTQGNYLRVLLKRDPVYLYPILLLQGFEHEKRVTKAMFEILIWHKGDDEAWEASHTGQDTG